MFNDFKNTLNSVREQGENVCKNSKCVNEICNSVNTELTAYSRMIHEFFSYNNEALKIKALYKKLRELDYTRNRVIPSIDVCRAMTLYTEYFMGMREFVHKFIEESCKSESTTSNLPLMEKQLQTAMNADPIFIDSLFGGKNNETQEIELTEAIKNVEYLVDFINVITEMHEYINSICSKAGTLFEKYSCITDAVRLITNSACSICNRVLATAFDTYEVINNVLDDKPMPPKPDNTFKVF